MRYNQLPAWLLLLLFTAPLAAVEPPVAGYRRTLKAAGVNSDPAGLLEFFRKNTPSAADEQRMEALVRQLGDDDFAAREKASAELVTIGIRVVPLLRRAVKDNDPEISTRAKTALQKIDLRRIESASVYLAATRLLAFTKPAGAAETLLAFLPASEDDHLSQEIRHALATLALRDSKPEPALLAALNDKQSLRRGAAAEALIRSNNLTARPAVRKLLQDTDPNVRLIVAMALTEAGDKEAVPVLIALLAELPAEAAWPAENLLYRLAGESAPQAVFGRDESSRQKFRKSWDQWWQTHEATTDLAKLHAAPRLLGYTMVILLDENRLLELDADKKVRWQIDNLAQPLDAQYLPNNHVLIAESQGNRVTERNLKGEVLWKKDIVSPLVAQRLSNGNTFIASRTQMVEVKSNGEEVFHHVMDGGEQIMRALKLPQGQIACVIQGDEQRFIRFDEKLKQLQSFSVQVSTYGGRIDLLPNGHLLLAEGGLNRLAEYDATGKVVWQHAIESPIVALRLPNGNTLVTSMNQKRAIELNREGTEVWQYQSGTSRVTRAWRR